MAVCVSKWSDPADGKMGRRLVIGLGISGHRSIWRGLEPAITDVLDLELIRGRAAKAGLESKMQSRKAWYTCSEGMTCIWAA